MLTAIIKKGFHDTDAKCCVGKQVQLRFWNLASVAKYIFENIFIKSKARYNAVWSVFLLYSGSIFIMGFS